MGCDIHVMTEVKVRKRDDALGGIWVNADKWSVNPHTQLYREDFDDEDFKEEYLEIHYDDRIYRGRDYMLFGFLAGVRGDNIQPISRPKGVPRDCSPEYRKLANQYGEDGHSHSYLTLKELEAVDWKKEVIRENFLTEEELSKIRPNKIIKREYKSSSQYIAVEYKVPLKEVFRDFYTRTLLKLQMIADRYKAEKDEVRIVFFFDN